MTPPPAHPADDVRDKKIEELRKQLQDLEQRTRPTRTSPDSVTHAKNFDFDQLNSNSKPTIQEVTPPPGLKSVYGTPQGSDRGEWEIDMNGMDEQAINLKILKNIDRNLNTQHVAQITSTGSGIRRDEVAASSAANHDGNEPKPKKEKKEKKEKKPRREPTPPPTPSPPSTPSSPTPPPTPPSSDSSPRPSRGGPRDDGDRTRAAPNPNTKVKEKDIKLQVLPEAPDFESWKDVMYHKVVAAAQRGYAMLPWIAKAEQPNTTFEELANSEGFETLDTALCAAVTQPEET